MSYQLRYCPACGTYRAAVAHRCSVCSGPVRVSRQTAHAEPAAPSRGRFDAHLLRVLVGSGSSKG